jgi:hypothetical protein
MCEELPLIPVYMRPTKFRSLQPSNVKPSQPPIISNRQVIERGKREMEVWVLVDIQVLVHRQSVICHLSSAPELAGSDKGSRVLKFNFFCYSSAFVQLP